MKSSSEKQRRDKADRGLPPLKLLSDHFGRADAGDVYGSTAIIRQTLEDFKVKAEVVGANISASFTQYTLSIPEETKYSDITELQSNFQMDLSTLSLRILTPIPGDTLVGIEIPNVHASSLPLRTALESKDWNARKKSDLSFVLGHDIDGSTALANLTRCKNILVVGQTRSGKSTMLHGLILSLLYSFTADELKLILIDTSMVELKPYDDISHLLAPVIIDIEKGISSLLWLEDEAKRRQQVLKSSNFDDISAFNDKQTDKSKKLPYIVVVIDELRDLMMLGIEEPESAIATIDSLTKSKDLGIHMVMATSRPNFDVMTKKIHSIAHDNFVFASTKESDPRVATEYPDAEKLLGLGDMLYMQSDGSAVKRLQTYRVDDEDLGQVTDYLRSQQAPNYSDDIFLKTVYLHANIPSERHDIEKTQDDYYGDAVRLVAETGKASTALLQQHLRIGYGNAVRLIWRMEKEGYIGPPDSANSREVYIGNRRKKVILYVEQDKELLKVYSNRMESEGYVVVQCTNVEDALVFATTEVVDLVVTDILLPKVSGLDLLDLLQQIPETRDTPIIVLTNVHNQDILAKATELGATDIIIKGQMAIDGVMKIIKKRLSKNSY